ncbi:MAG: hypothetical protein NTW96_02455 [Planctomycetia bacterium]|jgi:hypothetical protein|nr:hypothetical protein [Planctomycetia bacterium]
MSDVQRRSATITLRYDDDKQKVIVVDAGEDRFVFSVAEAVRACRVYDQLGIVRFRGQFESLLDYLGDWLAKHKEHVSKAVLTTRDAGLLFLVCTRKPEFDEAFEDELTTLDLSVARNDDFGLIRLSVLGIPDDSPSSINCFADPDKTWTYVS